MNMKPMHRHFRITPLVVPADAESEVVVQPLFDHVRFDPTAEYSVRCYPCEEFSLASGWPDKQPATAAVEDGAMRIRCYFEAEQEHVLLVERLEGERRTAVADVRIYSVGPDLYSRRPYKGDLHIHTNRSDGKESPAYVAGRCREIGLDFLAITDHRRYEPSLEAIAAYSEAPIDMRLFPGEEVHPPRNPVHIVNFGGSSSINALFGDLEAYQRSVDELEATLPPSPAGVDRYQYASATWCFRKIREAGGLAIFCHPYWFTDHRYSPAGALTSHLFRERPFDAYEIIGGYHLDEPDSNTLQVARYHDERAEGRTHPIVGVSDGHGCDTGSLFGWYYTIVFAPDNTLGGLTDSIRELWSVAVEALPGQVARPFGPFRLVKYALFLMREVFPGHDALCAGEGALMLAHAAGDPEARVDLGRLQGSTARYMDSVLRPSPRPAT